jgi:N utilization substance protein B
MAARSSDRKSAKAQPPRPQARPRTGARVAAVQALFQSEQAEESGETVIDQFTRHRLGAVPDAGGFEEGRVPDAHVPLFASIVRAAVRDQDAIDALIAVSLPAGGRGRAAHGERAADPRRHQRISRRGARLLHRR